MSHLLALLTGPRTPRTPEERALFVRYVEGQCGKFAAALHITFGWEVAVIPGVLGSNHVTDFAHALALRPDGLLVDISGPTAPQDVAARWLHGEKDDRVIRPLVHDEFVAFMHYQGRGPWYIKALTYITEHREDFRR